MMRPKVVIEDRLTEEQRKELEKKCQAVDTTDMSALTKQKKSLACGKTHKKSKKEKSMQITQRLVKDVKRSDRKVWHDKEWHTFQAKKEVVAIHYAMQVQKESEPASIVIAAQRNHKYE